VDSGDFSCEEDECNNDDDDDEAAGDSAENVLPTIMM